MMADLTFSPESSLWRINRELVLSLSGGRAVLLELAHPLIAEGVRQHSDVQAGQLGRLYRTARAATDLTFRDVGSARRAARHIHRRHQPVRGAMPEGVGPFDRGTPYSANDPFLKLWVLATLIDSTLQAYDFFLGPLAESEKTAYYQDCKQLARWLSIPAATMPDTYDSFQRYMQAMLSSDQLTVGPAAREIVASLYVSGSLGRLLNRSSFFAIGLLPRQVRADFGFSWSRRDQRRLERVALFTRRVRPWLPDFLAVNPAATLAEFRWRRGR